MNTILVHLGCQGPYIQNTLPPEHMDWCIRQYLAFNSAPLYVLTDRENMPHIAQRPGVRVAAAEDYYSAKVDQFHKGYKYAKDEFWGVTTTRFFYLEKFIEAHKLAPCIHFENDIMVYFDIGQRAQTFQKLYGPNLAYPLCDDTQATSGFMYIGSYEALAHFNAYVIDTMERLGMYGFENMIRKRHNVNMVMMNDMTLLRHYTDTRGVGGVGFLPILPYDEHSGGYEALGGIFDPGDYGQYFGGTRGQGPGVTYAGHYVGGVLRHNDYKLAWQTEAGLRVPYLDYDGKLARFNSLHIHSKNMEPFASKTDA